MITWVDWHWVMRATLTKPLLQAEKPENIHTGVLERAEAGAPGKYWRGHEGLCTVTRRVGLMSFQAANKLGPTQMVKIATYSSPQIVLNEGGATAAQNIILEVFPTNTDVRPFFSLGIVSSSVCGIGQRLGRSS